MYHANVKYNLNYQMSFFSTEKDLKDIITDLKENEAARLQIN